MLACQSLSSQTRVTIFNLITRVLFPFLLLHLKSSCILHCLKYLLRSSFISCMTFSPNTILLYNTGTSWLLYTHNISMKQLVNKIPRNWDLITETDFVDQLLCILQLGWWGKLYSLDNKIFHNGCRTKVWADKSPSGKKVFFTQTFVQSNLCPSHFDH